MKLINLHAIDNQERKQRRGFLQLWWKRNDYNQLTCLRGYEG